MSATGISPQAVVARLRAVLDEVAEIDPGALDAGEVEAVVVGLSAVGDVVGGELARFAAAVAGSGSWRAAGASSAAAWLSRRTGIGFGRARGAIELGEAMAAVPELDAAVRAGELSPAAAATVIPAVNDAGFAEVAGLLIGELTGMTPAAAARHVEGWRAVANPVDDVERRASAREGRWLTFRPLGDGITHVEGVVPNETARTLRQALAHLAAQQRLDRSGRTRAQRTVDALGELAAAYNRGEVTGGRNLPRVIVTMTLHDLESRCGVGRDTFNGEVITSTEIDRMCCDSTIHRYVADQDGVPLNLGRGRRTVSPSQFLAMVARDGGCRHPGCDRPPQWCEAHHLREFAARGGLTDLDEMVLLCHHHHHALHDDGWVLSGDPVLLTFTGPAGQILYSPLRRPDQRLSDRQSLPGRDTTNAA